MDDHLAGKTHVVGITQIQHTYELIKIGRLTNFSSFRMTPQHSLIGGRRIWWKKKKGFIWRFFSRFFLLSGTLIIFELQGHHPQSIHTQPKCTNEKKRKIIWKNGKKLLTTKILQLFCLLLYNQKRDEILHVARLTIIFLHFFFQIISSFPRWHNLSWVLTLQLKIIVQIPIWCNLIRDPPPNPPSTRNNMPFSCTLC